MSVTVHKKAKPKVEIIPKEMGMEDYKKMVKRGKERLMKFKKGILKDEENLTGIEESLVDEYLDIMIKINDYVYTTSSTNSPDNPDFQEMFIQFTAPKSMMMKIKDEIEKNPDYYYLIQIPKTSRIIASYNTNDKNALIPEIAANPGDLPEMIETDLDKEDDVEVLYDIEDSWGSMIIDDPVQKRRDLYDVLLKILKKLF